MINIILIKIIIQSQEITVINEISHIINKYILSFIMQYLVYNSFIQY